MIGIMERSPVCILVILLLVVIAVSSCSLFGKKKEIKPLISEVVHPEWSKKLRHV